MHSQQDTIAAIATPIGESGVGMIRLSGSAAIAIIQKLFKSAKGVDLTSVPTQTCHFGTITAGSPLTTCGDDVRGIDQAIVTVFRAPQSYTGDDIVEISAHGSPFILNQILEACTQNGARLAQPGEFTERAFLSGKIDLTQAEAVADLIRAKTDQAHGAALAQLEGKLAAKVRGLRDQLLPLLAHVEVGLDHSDEDHDFLLRAQLTEKCQNIQQEIESLLTSARVGKILREGLQVALVGRPNVGKSSLLNALLKEERAIVTPIPGTTRDTLEENVNWDGIPVVLTDTAGLRADSTDPVERIGIERTRKALQKADVVLCLFDGSEPLTDEDRNLIQECGVKPHLWVINKGDLPQKWAAPHLASLNGGSPTLPVSAKTGEGLLELVRAVKDLSLQGQASAGAAQWMINARHQSALQRAHEALTHATQAAQDHNYEECVALELRSALQALGDIIGETSTEDLLDNVFANFCIGK